jgi:hydrogenase nickel incorporation protein HypA/HybF
LVYRQDCNCREFVKILTMHEIRIAEDLAAIVLETAFREGLSEVTSVNVSFGQLVQIVPDIFKFAFSEAVRGTIAANAAVAIEILPVKLKCSDCGSESELAGNLFACQKCSSTDLEILQGREVFIKTIEGE